MEHSPLTTPQKARLAEFVGGIASLPEIIKSNGLKDSAGWTFGKHAVVDSYWLPDDTDQTPYWQIKLLLDAVSEKGFEVLIQFGLSERWSVRIESETEILLYKEGESLPLTLCHAILQLEDG